MRCALLLSARVVGGRESEAAFRVRAVLGVHAETLPSGQLAVCAIVCVCVGGWVGVGGGWLRACVRANAGASVCVRVCVCVVSLTLKEI